MKLGIVLHKEDTSILDELVDSQALTLIRRRGLLCEVESEVYPMVKAKLGRSVVVPTSYSMYEKAHFS